MFNDIGVPVKLVTPGYPVSVMGLKLVPDVGGLITQKPHQSLPEELPEAPTDTSPEVPEASIDSELEETKPKPAFNLILKADAQGTLEAIIHSALHDEVTLISKGVGPINESDILLAQITHSLIIGFNIPITPSAKKLAKTEKIAVKQFNIIYKLLEFLEEKILTMIEPTINEEDLGTAQVAAVFNIRNQSIAGCKVTAGKIDQTLPIHLVRKDKIVKDAKIKSLKSGKDDISVAKSGTECGIILEPILDVRVGDVIKSYRIIEE
jgi:translation initiation factor IF-2